jgi:hypothetical protein
VSGSIKWPACCAAYLPLVHGHDLTLDGRNFGRFDLVSVRIKRPLGLPGNTFDALEGVELIDHQSGRHSSQRENL